MVYSSTFSFVIQGSFKMRHICWVVSEQCMMKISKTLNHIFPFVLSTSDFWNVFCLNTFRYLRSIQHSFGRGQRRAERLPGRKPAAFCFAAPRLPSLIDHSELLCPTENRRVVWFHRWIWPLWERCPGVCGALSGVPDRGRGGVVVMQRTGQDQHTGSSTDPRVPPVPARPHVTGTGTGNTEPGDDLRIAVATSQSTIRFIFFDPLSFFPVPVLFPTSTILFLQTFPYIVSVHFKTLCWHAFLWCTGVEYFFQPHQLPSPKRNQFWFPFALRPYTPPPRGKCFDGDETQPGFFRAGGCEEFVEMAVSKKNVFLCIKGIAALNSK